MINWNNFQDMVVSLHGILHTPIRLLVILSFKCWCELNDVILSNICIIIRETIFVNQQYAMLGRELLKTEMFINSYITNNTRDLKCFTYIYISIQARMYTRNITQSFVFLWLHHFYFCPFYWKTQYNFLFNWMDEHTKLNWSGQFKMFFLREKCN